MNKIDEYFKSSSSVIGELGAHKKDRINFEKLYPTKNNKKILVAGNGGSCADAEHFVGELQCT